MICVDIGDNKLHMLSLGLGARHFLVYLLIQNEKGGLCRRSTSQLGRNVNFSQK